MDLQEIKKISEELQSKLEKVLVSADPSLVILVKSLTMMLNALLSMMVAKEQQNEALIEQVSTLTKTILELQETIKDLKRQLGQNSQNSSKPPSTDGYKKPKPRSLREKTERKAGGQKGHKGAHMEIPHYPDKIVTHVPEKCKNCPLLERCKNNGRSFSCSEKRYEVNVEIKTIVTEHQLLRVRKCLCGEAPKGVKGEFPANLTGYVQYGDSFSVIATILNTFGAVSYNRIATIINNLTGLHLSEGTLTSMVSRCSSKLEVALNTIKEKLQGSKIVHFDETGVRVNGKLFWVHNSSTDKYTNLTINRKRGFEGIEDNGVLPNFKGIAIHDFWSAYYKFENARHGACDVHILRELNGVIDNEEKQTWASKFKDYLTKWLRNKKEFQESKIEKFPKEKIDEFENEYDEIIRLAEQEFPEIEPSSKKKRGRIKQGKVRSLIMRLKTYKDAVSYYIRDFDVPFDNNQAERDVRNVKTKSKIAGSFRSEKGAKDYLRIISYINTAKKHGIDAYKALSAAFAGNADIIFGQGSE